VIGVVSLALAIAFAWCIGGLSPSVTWPGASRPDVRRWPCRSVDEQRIIADSASWTGRANG
jgi:hypothetical protein